MDADRIRGVLIFDVLEQFKDDLTTPRSIKDLPEFEAKARLEGFTEVADYLKSWRLFLEYHIKAEWDERD